MMIKERFLLVLVVQAIACEHLSYHKLLDSSHDKEDVSKFGIPAPSRRAINLPLDHTLFRAPLMFQPAKETYGMDGSDLDEYFFAHRGKKMENHMET